MRPRYHIRWKVIMWAMMLVAVSFILTGILSPIIGEALSDYISVVERGWFILWINQGLTSILFFVFVLLLAIFTSKTMVNRILELSQAAKQIAKGDFSVRISDVDRHDEVYQLAKDFNRMAEQLQSNEYMRKDFISNVSHEIKTPLSVINGYVDLLQEDPPEKDRREYLNVISRESRRLLHLSQNLLQISQLDNDRIFLEEAEFRLDEQIRQVILLLEPNWSKKNIDLGIDLDECTYRGKEELLVQVWVNLLDNAIKFTEPGGQIIIRLQKRESLRLRIADTGSGMDEETRRRVFEQFYQGDPSRKLEGAGLGMSIVKRILDLHAADIFIDSEPGKGTEIEVVLSSKKPSQF